MMDITRQKYDSISIMRPGITADRDKPIPHFDIHVYAPIDSLTDDQMKSVKARLRELRGVKEACIVCIHVYQPMTVQELSKVREFIHELDRQLPLFY